MSEPLAPEWKKTTCIICSLNCALDVQTEGGHIVKAEATFFNVEFPRNGFHPRQPLFPPRPGTLTEAEIHARLVESLGELGCDLQPGHVALPNGHGLDYTAADGTPVHKGVSLNELTDTASRDPFAGAPWHKFVPVKIERPSTTKETSA